MAYPRQEKNRVDWLGLWILVSAWCAVSGWSLSALGCLNPAGVCVSAVAFGAVLFLLWRPLELAEKSRARGWHLFRSRGLLPKVWLVLALLELIGGLIYVPNNYDYLTYRFPRLLYWSWEQHWYWIPTVNDRMNISGTQFEWMMAPLFILFKTDRLFFLINIASYLFLPGLVFSVFRGLGISGRISWWWMWVLPSGYCFVLQAGSVGNDSFAAVYLLASLHFLFRARASGSAKYLVLSTLAIALVTGAKASNLPLVLPWAVLLFFTRGPVFAKATPAILAVTLLAAVCVSFIPTALLNRQHTGDFFGDPTNSGRMKVDGPIGGIVGNLLVIGSENIAPPLWYQEFSWNEDVPAFLRPMIKHSFPRFGLTFREMPVEEGAGVGLGCVVGAALFLALGLRARIFDRTLTTARRVPSLWITSAVAIAALVYMSKIATEAAPRVVTPYYALVIAGVLVMASLDGRVMRRGWLTWAGFLAMLSAFPIVILSPSRPLYPTQMVSTYLASHASAKLSERFQSVYSAYSSRAFSFQEIIPFIPPEDRTIGFLQNGDAEEVSLWRPFGSRKLVDVTPADSAEELKAKGVHLVVVSQEAIQWVYHTDIASLLGKWSAHLVAQKDLALKADRGATTWYVISLD